MAIDRSAADGQADAKRARIGSRLTPDEIEEGTQVLYFGGRRGVVRDAYQPLNEFWITDAETGEIVKEGDSIVTFRAADLQLAPPAPPADLGVGSVLLIVREETAVQVLTSFGEANTQQRCEPQQLLAIPCNMLGDASGLAEMAKTGVIEEVVALGKKMRPDIDVDVRATQLEGAVQRIGSSLEGLEGYFLLAAVQIPEPLESIAAVGGSTWEVERRRDVLNQVELCPTATTVHPSTQSPGDAARAALGQTCGLEVSDMLWSAAQQQSLRKKLCVDLPLRVTDSCGAQVEIAVLPEEVVATRLHGVLCLTEAPTSPTAATGATNNGGAKQADQSASPEAGGAAGKSEGDKVGGRTAAEWEAGQAEEFGHLPPLPAGWLRVRSRSSGEVYFLHRKTKETTFETPEDLPPGWTRQVSKSTGKAYYHNAARKLSSFDKPRQ